jgi:Domain of unknown function (DUF4838)/Glycosyl hydrolase family 67 N-terminus
VKAAELVGKQSKRIFVEPEVRKPVASRLFSLRLGYERSTKLNRGFRILIAVLGCFMVARAALADATVSAESNAVLNGAFKSGKSRWWGTGGTVGVFSSDGRLSLKLAEGFVCQDKIPITGGQRYRIRMIIRTEAAVQGAVFVQISYRGADVDPGWRGPESVQLTDRTEPALFVTGGTHDWWSFSAIVEAPPGAREFLIYLRKADKTPGDALFSDIVVTETTGDVSSAADLKKSELMQLVESRQSPRVTDLNIVATPTVISLAVSGHSDYKIDVGPDPDVITLGAAAELADYMQRVSGANFLPLLQEPRDVDEPLIVLGRNNPLTRKLAPDLPYSTLGEDGFVIKYVGRHVVIAGATSRGTMYGVNWLLDRRIGVKWLDPNFTYIPSKPNLNVAPSDEIQVPRFQYREVLSAEGEDKRFRAHNLLNGESHGPSFSPSPPGIDTWRHDWSARGGEANFIELLPPAVYGKDHPDWYAGGQLAMMNKALRREMASVLITRLRALPDYRNTWFEVRDMDWGWDMDGESRTFADAHGHHPSAPRLDMMIDVADQVRAVLADAKFAFNAYHWSFTPPDGMRVPNYLLVVPMTIHVDYSSALDKARNQGLGRDINGWNAIGNHVLVWDHVTNFAGFIQPTPNIYPIGESIKWLATLNNVEGYFAEGSWNTPAAEFASLRVWLIARLLWNPNEDLRYLISEYCDLYFGHSAGPFILRYIDLIHAAIGRSGDILGEMTQLDMRMFDLDFIRSADDLMEHAAAAASSSSLELKHVQEARMPLDYVILARRNEYRLAAKSSGQEWDDHATSRYARLMATAKSAGVREYRQGGNLEELSAFLSVERHPAEPSGLISGRPKSDWFELQDLSFNRYSSATIVPDSIASDGASARISGSDSSWAVQIKLDKLPKGGCWDLYVDVRVDGDAELKNENVARVGSYPPMGRFSELNSDEFRDGRYHPIKVPGGPFTYGEDFNQGVYVQPVTAEKTSVIYVDRVIGVRTKCQLN